MTATRFDHLTDAWNSLSKAKRLVAAIHATMAGHKPNDLNDANRHRIRTMIALAKDAIACGEAALEGSEG